MNERQKTLSEREAKLEKFNEDLQTGTATYRAKTEAFAEEMAAKNAEVEAAKSVAGKQWNVANQRLKHAEEIVAEANQKRQQAELMMAQATALSKPKPTLAVSAASEMDVREGERWMWLRNKRTGELQMVFLQEDYYIDEDGDFEVAPRKRNDY